MIKQYSSTLIGFFTLILVISISCSFPKPSETCFCKELMNVSQYSLPEKPQNHSPIQLSSLSFNSMMTASGTAMASVSPSPEFWESDMS